jgi:hypothetical protein
VEGGAQARDVHGRPTVAQEVDALHPAVALLGPEIDEKAARRRDRVAGVVIDDAMGFGIEGREHISGGRPRHEFPHYPVPGTAHVAASLHVPERRDAEHGYNGQPDRALGQAPEVDPRQMRADHHREGDGGPHHRAGGEHRLSKAQGQQERARDHGHADADRPDLSPAG